MVENVQKCLGLLFGKGGNVVFERIRSVLLTFLETNVEQNLVMDPHSGIL